MKKELQDYILELLKQFHVPGIRISHNNIRSQCVFHRPNERKLVSVTFSIAFNQEHAPFQCFSCGKQGNIVSLIMYLYQCDYKKAVKIFSKKVALTPIHIGAIEESYNAMFTKDYDAQLFNTEVYPLVDLPPKHSSKLMLEYLHWRNSHEQHNIMNVPYIVSRYGLYYCDGGRYAKRIIMPIRDFHGRIVYFTNRSIYHDSETKNLFTIGGHSSNFVYGLYEAMGKCDDVFICEGPFEVYQMESFFLKEKIKDKATVAIMGTDMNVTRAAQIAACFKRAFILFDNGDDVWKKNPKTRKSKLDIAYNILSDFMPTFNITDQLYKDKEPATSTRSQLRKIIEYKPETTLKLVDKALKGWW